MELTQENVQAISCPGCGEKKLRLEWRIKAILTDDDKLTMRDWPWILCDGCGEEAEGKLL